TRFLLAAQQVQTIYEIDVFKHSDSEDDDYQESAKRRRMNYSDVYSSDSDHDNSVPSPSS
ncbi:hypothetical protein J6590_107200, partial [Homalodisca vitripennis]